MRLTLKNIIRWEQLMNLSFSMVDFNNEKHTAALIYIATEQPVTFDIFMKTIFSKGYKQEALSLINELKRTNQFLPQRESKKGASQEEQTIGELAYSLIAKGIDAHYIMNELSIIDLPYLIEAISNKDKQDMESQRLWTYLSILPHVDSSKLKSPKDIMPFPWDIDQEAIEREKHEAFHMFNQFTESYGK